MGDPIHGGPGGGSNVLTDFARGFVGDARGKDASVAQIAGDLAGALTPGLGEIKGLKDVFEGVRSHDAGLLIGGLIQLIPVVGAVGRGGEKVAGQVAKKGLSKTALQYQAVAKRAITKALNDPGTRKKLEKAAMEAGQVGLSRLVARLEAMGEGGETPDVTLREHGSFIDARKSAELGMNGKPTPKWFDMYDEDPAGKQVVVGRHEVSTGGGDVDSVRGFRLFGPQGEDGTTRVMWWNNPDAGEPKFGVETCKTSTAEFDAIMKAYLMRKKSFRPR